jgi:hypothetical protein
MLNSIAATVEYYLPVFIPIFLSVLTVLSGILTGRIALNFSSLLKVHSDIVMGLFGFIVWALVTYQQTGKIGINEDQSITLIRVVLLLFANFFALIIGLIILKHAWGERPGLSRVGLSSGHARENISNGVFLALTIVLVFSPLSLSVKNPVKPETAPVAEQRFRVSVPYLDESLAEQLGARNWKDRLLCEVVQVTAPTPEKALGEALSQFDQAGRRNKMFPKYTSAQVVVYEHKITAQRN